MLGFCRVFSDIEVTIFSRLTMEMLIGFVMCIFLIVQCSKKKPEKSPSSHGSKQLLDESTAAKSARKKRSKDKATLDGKKSGENLEKNSKKSKKTSGKSGDGAKTKTKSKLSKTGSKRSRRTGESESKSQIKQSGGSSKPMDGTQNGPTPNDPTGGLNSEYKDNDDTLYYDEIKNREPMEDTIEETDNPAVHERVTRLAATDMIFDPKKVSYMGNVDNEKDPEEEKQFERELLAACEKHEARFKDIRKLEERNPNYRRPKSTESEKSHAPVPPDQRIKMRPDQCQLFETKDLMTEEDEEPVADDSTNKAS